jgi:hypothetical protein
MVQTDRTIQTFLNSALSKTKFFNIHEHFYLISIWRYKTAMLIWYLIITAIGETEK